MLGFTRNSLSYKTTLIYVVMGVIIISVFNFIIWENQSDLIVENQKLIIQSISNKLRQMVQENNLESNNNLGDEGRYLKIARSAVDEGIIQTVVFSEGGHSLFQFQEERKSSFTSENELVLINRSIARFELENKGFLHRTNVASGNIDLYLPFALKNGAMMVVKFVMPLLQLTKKKNDVLMICFWVALVVVMLQIVMALFLRRLIISPISKLVKMTKKVAMGDLKQKIHLKQQDEIGILATAYNEMVVNLDRMQKEAMGANPLSGLPGNLAIMRTIDEQLKKKKNVAIIYGDLDNFKAYNDTYGLNRGDEAILHTRDCFVQAAKEAGGNSTFVGHEGGDDFVIVTDFDTWEPICRKVVEKFDKGVPKFYSQNHNQQGYINAKDRQGNNVRYPLMSVSLAVVSNHFRAAADHRILIAWAAEMKKVVKKKQGSVYAIDKRRR